MKNPIFRASYITNLFLAGSSQLFLLSSVEPKNEVTKLLEKVSFLTSPLLNSSSLFTAQGSFLDLAASFKMKKDREQKERVSVHVQFAFPSSLEEASKITCDACGRFTYCVEIRIEGEAESLNNCGLCLLNLRKNLERADEGRLLHASAYRELDKAIKKASKIGRDRIIK